MTEAFSVVAPFALIVMYVAVVITVLLYAGYLRQTNRHGLWLTTLALALVVLIVRFVGRLGEWQSWLNIVLDFLVGAFLADLLVEHLLGHHNIRRH